MVRSVKPFPTAGVVSGVHATCPARDSAGEPGSVQDDRAATVLIRKLNTRLHRQPGLQSFHEMGRILNTLAPPSRMTARHHDTMDRVAKAIGVDKRELTYMQWLAQHFRTVEDLEARHPGAKKWSRAKILDFVDSLTQSRVPVGYEPKRGAAGRLSKAQARQVTRLLKSAGDAIAALDGIDLEQSEEVWDDVFKAIRELLRVTQWRLDVRFTVRRRSEPRCDAVDVPMW
jgi:hypothetical protein